MADPSRSKFTPALYDRTSMSRGGTSNVATGCTTEYVSCSEWVSSVSGQGLFKRTQALAKSAHREMSTSGIIRIASHDRHLLLWTAERWEILRFLGTAYTADRAGGAGVDLHSGKQTTVSGRETVKDIAPTTYGLNHRKGFYRVNGLELNRFGLW